MFFLIVYIFLVLKDSKVDVTIGPYETYEDVLFGYKVLYIVFVIFTIFLVLVHVLCVDFLLYLLRNNVFKNLS